MKTSIFLMISLLLIFACSENSSESDPDNNNVPSEVPTPQANEKTVKLKFDQNTLWQGLSSGDSLDYDLAVKQFKSNVLPQEQSAVLLRAWEDAIANGVEINFMYGLFYYLEKIPSSSPVWTPELINKVNNKNTHPDAMVRRAWLFLVNSGAPLSWEGKIGPLLDDPSSIVRMEAVIAHIKKGYKETLRQYLKKHRWNPERGPEIRYIYTQLYQQTPSSSQTKQKDTVDLNHENSNTSGQGKEK